MNKLQIHFLLLHNHKHEWLHNYLFSFHMLFCIYNQSTDDLALNYIFQRIDICPLILICLPENRNLLNSSRADVPFAYSVNLLEKEISVLYIFRVSKRGIGLKWINSLSANPTI